MGLEAIEKELEAAYVDLEKANNRITSLLVDRVETEKTIEVLKAAGFLTEEKLNQARDIIMKLEI